MVIDGGNVAELVVKPSSVPRVPLTEAHRQGIIDPLTAMLPAAPQGLDPQLCRRTLPIFDGYQRYDLNLEYKRMDKVKEDQGYEGPALVCSGKHHAIAGHPENDRFPKYLAGNEIEVTLAPVAGTRVLAPFRIAVTTPLGDLRVQATRFEVQASSVPSALPDAP